MPLWLCGARWHHLHPVCQTRCALEALPLLLISLELPERSPLDAFHFTGTDYSESGTSGFGSVWWQWKHFLLPCFQVLGCHPSVCVGSCPLPHLSCSNPNYSHFTLLSNPISCDPVTSHLSEARSASQLRLSCWATHLHTYLSNQPHNYTLWLSQRLLCLHKYRLISDLFPLIPHLIFYLGEWNLGATWPPSLLCPFIQLTTKSSKFPSYILLNLILIFLDSILVLDCSGLLYLLLHPSNQSILQSDRFFYKDLHLLTSLNGFQ